MTDPQDVSEDRGLKALFSTYPGETLEVFVPELLAERGTPTRIETLQQEVPLPNLGEPSRFLDVALLATWTDGSQAVILLIEHWSEARKVELTRVLWYTTALAVRHSGAAILPVILVTEPTADPVPDRLTWRIIGREVLDFRVQVVQVGPADLPRLRRLQNHVAALFLALALRSSGPIAAAVAAMLAMADLPTTLDDLRRFLPLAVKLARIHTSELPLFYTQLRQENHMWTIFDELEAEAKAKGEAKGKAEGKAEGVILALRDLVAQGILPVDGAQREIRRLIDQGLLPESIGAEAIQRLG